VLTTLQQNDIVRVFRDWVYSLRFIRMPQWMSCSW